MYRCMQAPRRELWGERRDTKGRVRGRTLWTVKRLHLGMGEKWKFWFPQTRLLNHDPGCGYLYSPNSLVYTTCLDANQRMEVVEAVRCAAWRDRGIGFTHVVLTQLHMAAHTSAAEGGNENMQSPGHLPSLCAWANGNKRHGVDLDYSGLFLHDPPNLSSSITHYISSPPLPQEPSTPSSLGSEYVMLFHAFVF